MEKKTKSRNYHAKCIEKHHWPICATIVVHGQRNQKGHEKRDSKGMLKKSFRVDQRYMLTYIDVYKLSADRIVTGRPVQRSVLEKEKNRTQEEIPKILPHDSMSIKCTIKLYYYDGIGKRKCTRARVRMFRAYTCVCVRKRKRAKGIGRGILILRCVIE